MPSNQKIPRAQRVLTVVVIGLLAISLFATPVAGFFWNEDESVCEPSNGVNFKVVEVVTDGNTAEGTIKNVGSQTGTATVQGKLDGEPISSEEITLDPGDTRVVAISNPNIENGDFTLVTPHWYLGADPDYAGGCKIEETDSETTWDIPPRIEDSGLSSAEYTDLWYGITTIDEGTTQYEVLRQTIEENLGNTPGSQFVLGVRSEDVDAFTTENKPHTSEWNQELSQKEIEGDIATYLPTTQLTDDTPVIEDVGTEIMTVDPHTVYIEPNGGSNVFSDSNKRHYINRNPAITVATTDPDIEPRDDTYGDDDPLTSKTEYSISDQTITETLVIETPSETRRVEDAFSGGVLSKDVEISEDVPPGSDITFKVEYTVAATEKKEEFSRTASEETNEEGETVGYDYGPWERDSVSYTDYETTTTDSVTREIYDPTVNIEYDAVENSPNNQLYFQMEVKNTQPISGISPQGPRESGRNLNTETVYHSNSFFSVSQQRYRGTFSAEGILPVRHYSTPTDTDTIKRGPYQDNVDVTSVSGLQGTYSDPSSVSLPIRSPTVMSIEQMSLFGKYNVQTFDEEAITAEPLVPNTPVEINTQTAEFTDKDIKVVDTTIRERSTSDGEIELTIITTDESGSRISTSNYEESYVDLRVSGAPQKIETTSDGTATTVIDPTPPTNIRGQVTTDERALADETTEQSSILLGTTGTASISTEQVDLEESSLTIMTAIIRRFLWYVLPAVILLALCTKAMTDEWIPYTN